jgi:hypothetical protein
LCGTTHLFPRVFLCFLRLCGTRKSADPENISRGFIFRGFFFFVRNDPYSFLKNKNKTQNTSLLFSSFLFSLLFLFLFFILYQAGGVHLVFVQLVFHLVFVQLVVAVYYNLIVLLPLFNNI